MSINPPRKQLTEQLIVYFGHVVRRNGLEKVAIQEDEKVKEDEADTPTTRYTDHIVANVSFPLAECARITEDREKWRDISKTKYMISRHRVRLTTTKISVFRSSGNKKIAFIERFKTNTNFKN